MIIGNFYIEKYNLDIPIFGMVKDSHHRTRAIACSGDELSLTSKRAAFTLVSTIQEEVHRFTVSCMSAAKRKTLRTSSLEKVKGIGPAKAKALLQHFGTLANMRGASVWEIEGVRGVSRSEAESVYEFLHKTTTDE